MRERKNPDLPLAMKRGEDRRRLDKRKEEKRTERR